MAACNLSHNELASNLARHLLSGNRMVWEDIPAGKSGSVRPDVYTIEKSYANPNPISYEIKVSLSDFRSDITSAKWKAYLDFSYGVVFAVPKGLVTKKDIPNGCGLITFNGEFWNTVKRPTLHPTTLDSELLLKLLIEGRQRETHPFTPIQRDFNEQNILDGMRRKFGEDLRKKIHFFNDYPKKVAELDSMRNELADILGIDVSDRSWGVDYYIQKQVEQLRLIANETERKAQIAKEVERMRSNLNGNIDRLIEQYTGCSDQ
ncbi:MmcB family DNA repair protein [Enterovibrio paralichthyis]|uniref:MmcB family DNA repair protein n=1 Tax=Enterovibrio paralichthyis TaxID=2853805 RepID=UPI001C4575A2|nr:MmcB family DNA repair protein [Enterovibrio paralichthyis]MBV7300239.1 MmcB family DNA repair protein [Enterovibrio paralichthyis]